MNFSHYDIIDFNKYYHSKKKSKGEFAKQHIYERRLNKVVELFSLLPAPEIQYTKKNITAQPLSFGASPFYAIIKAGIPFFEEKNKYGMVTHLIKTYRKRVGKCILLTNLHFVKGRLLYTHLCFIKADAELQKSIYSCLQEKYDCQLPLLPEFVLKDSHGNCIKGSSGIELNLYYLSGNQQDLQVVTDEQSRISLAKEKISLNRIASLNSLL